MAHRSVPSGVQHIAWSRTVLYIGWGFGEPLIPVFIMGLAGSYALSGLVNAAFDVTLLLSLPIIGVLAERYAAKWLVVAGLVVYPFIGIAYFLAGAIGALAFVVLARALNGVSWGLSSIGIDTYFRRLSPRGSLATSFGFIETLSEFGWILAALCGILLVRFFPIHILFLAIVPFSLLALPFALAARRDHPALGRGAKKLSLQRAYRLALDEWRGWSGALRLLALLVLFVELVTVLIEFFIPIGIYQESGNLALVVVFTVVTALPAAFGYLLGQAADHHDKARLVALACFLMSLVLGALALPLPYLLTVFAGLVLGVLIEMLSILQRTMATRLAPAEHWGRLDSVFSLVSSVSALAAPPLLGVALDLVGLPVLASVLAAVALLLAFIFVVSLPHPRGSKPHLVLSIPPPEHSV